MSSRSIARLLAFVVLTTSAFAFQDESTFDIRYPIANYKLEKADEHRAARTSAIAELQRRLAEAPSISLEQAGEAIGGPSNATDLRLVRVAPPIRVIWNNPRFLFRPPAVVEWIELVDERGQIEEIWITASNQSTTNDALIIRYCTSELMWKSDRLDDRPTRTLRLAGVNLASSHLHYSYWTGQLSTVRGKVIAALIVATLLWLVARVLGFRHHERMRHEQLMSRIRRTRPFKPPSVDDEF